MEVSMCSMSTSMAALRLLYWEAWVASEAIPILAPAKPIPSRVAMVTTEMGFHPWVPGPSIEMILGSS